MPVGHNTGVTVTQFPLLNVEPGGHASVVVGPGTLPLSIWTLWYLVGIVLVWMFKLHMSISEGSTLWTCIGCKSITHCAPCNVYPGGHVAGAVVVVTHSAPCSVPVAHVAGVVVVVSHTPVCGFKEPVRTSHWRASDTQTTNPPPNVIEVNPGGHRAPGGEGNPQTNITPVGPGLGVATPPPVHTIGRPVGMVVGTLSLRELG